MKKQHKEEKRQELMKDMDVHRARKINLFKKTIEELNL